MEHHEHEIILLTILFHFAMTLSCTRTIGIEEATSQAQSVSMNPNFSVPFFAGCAFSIAWLIYLLRAYSHYPSDRVISFSLISCTSSHQVAHIILVFYWTLFTTRSDLNTTSLPSFHCLFMVLLSFLWPLLCLNQHWVLHTPPRLDCSHVFTLYCSTRPSYPLVYRLVLLPRPMSHACVGFFSFIEHCQSVCISTVPVIDSSILFPVHSLPPGFTSADADVHVIFYFKFVL